MRRRSGTGQSPPSAHRNGCHCGHRPLSPASVPTTATGPLSPSAVPRSREVTLNLTRVHAHRPLLGQGPRHTFGHPLGPCQCGSRGTRFTGCPATSRKPFRLSSTSTHLERSESVPRPAASKYAVLMTLAGIERLSCSGLSCKGAIHGPEPDGSPPLSKMLKLYPPGGRQLALAFRLASQTAQNPSPDRADCSVVFDGRCRDYGM